jgi:hypothetical protein
MHRGADRRVRIVTRDLQQRCLDVLVLDLCGHGRGNGRKAIRSLPERVPEPERDDVELTHSVGPSLLASVPESGVPPSLVVLPSVVPLSPLAPPPSPGTQ